MSCYLIADVEVWDAAKYAEYAALSPATVAAHGGRYLARGGSVTQVEGTWKPGRTVIVEFPNLAALQRWYDSPEYAALRGVRGEAARAEIVAVEGV